MFISAPEQRSLGSALNRYLVACQRDDQKGATQALRELYAGIDVLDARLALTLNPAGVRTKRAPRKTDPNKPFILTEKSTGKTDPAPDEY